MPDDRSSPHPAARLAAAVAGTRRRAVTVLLAWVAVAAVSLFIGKQIHVNTNLEALLARDAPSVLALDELRERQGSTDRLNIAVKSDDGEAARRLIEDFAERLREWPEVVDITTDRDYTPIRDRALYFLEVEDLGQLRDRLKAERQRAVARKLSLGGGDVDLEQVVVGDDWDVEDEGEEEEGEPPAANEDTGGEKQLSVRELLDEQRAKLAADPHIGEDELEVIWPEEDENGRIPWHDRVGKPYVSPDGKVQLLQAKLTKSATDLAFASNITDRVNALADELDLTSYAPDMLLKIGGSYATSGEAKSIKRDLRRATWLSATLVASVLIAGFRSPRGLIIVLGPLATAVMITLAAAYLVLGELNVLTAFLFAVLLGIGVDFSVHLYTQRESQGPVGDWSKVLEHHFRPLAASMLTTLGSFLILLLADFKGFREFGLIAAIGVLVCFVVAVAMVPALDVALGRTRSRPREPAPPAPETGVRHRAPMFRWLTLGIVAAVGIAGAPRVAFETDLGNLRAPRSQKDKQIAYRTALGSKRSGVPVAILADSPEQLDEAVALVEADRGTAIVTPEESAKYGGESWIKDVISLSTHMPKDQHAKQPILQEIAATSAGFLAELPDLPDDEQAKKYDSHLEALHKLASQPPLRPEDLPDWAKDLFRERDGTIDEIGLLYVYIAVWNLDQVMRVTKRFREVTDGTGVRGASSRFILGDLTMEVEKDTQRLPPLALLAIFVLIAIEFRRARATLACFVTLCLGLLLSFGIMGLWPININFYNLVVMPAVVGLGIDASIHLWHSRRLGTSRATSKAATVSALTTAGGFSGLLIAGHGGLQSIGRLGVVATLCCVAVALLALGWPRRNPG